MDSPASLLLGLLTLSVLVYAYLQSMRLPILHRLFQGLLAVSLIALAWFSASELAANYDASFVFDRIRWQIEDALLGVGALAAAAFVTIGSAARPKFAVMRGTIRSSGYHLPRRSLPLRRPGRRTAQLAVSSAV